MNRPGLQEHGASKCVLQVSGGALKRYANHWPRVVRCSFPRSAWQLHAKTRKRTESQTSSSHVRPSARSLLLSWAVTAVQGWALAFNCGDRYLVNRLLGKTIVMVLLCHSSECGCFVCFACLCSGDFPCCFLFGCKRQKNSDLIYELEHDCTCMPLWW